MFPRKSWLVIFSILALSCHKENLPPDASFSVYPYQGDSITVFYFDARNTFDPESPAYGIQIRWNWNSDTIWDTDYLTQKEYVRRFNKAGWHHITMEARDIDGNINQCKDSIYIFEGNGYVDTLTDIRDGQKYQIARINYKWIMTDNLRYGQAIEAPKPSMDNDTIEFYYYRNMQDYELYGSLYTFDEINYYSLGKDTKGICPPGWHVPNREEWSEVLKIFPHNADMNYYLGPDSPSGFNLRFNGFMYYTDPPDAKISWYPQSTVSYWCNDTPTPYLEDPDLFIYSIRFFQSKWEEKMLRYRFDDYWDERTLLRFACYLRCFKDN